MKSALTLFIILFSLQSSADINGEISLCSPALSPELRESQNLLELEYGRLQEMAARSTETLAAHRNHLRSIESDMRTPLSNFTSAKIRADLQTAVGELESKGRFVPYWENHFVRTDQDVKEMIEKSLANSQRYRRIKEDAYQNFIRRYPYPKTTGLTHKAYEQIAAAIVVNEARNKDAVDQAKGIALTYRSLNGLCLNVNNTHSTEVITHKSNPAAEAFRKSELRNLPQ